MSFVGPIIHTSCRILLSYIKNNYAIHGFKFNENSEFEIKIVQMADDTTAFTSKMLSVSNLLKETYKFSSVSGNVMKKQKKKQKQRNLVR